MGAVPNAAPDQDAGETTGSLTVAAILAELQVQREIVNRAYWHFTRSARGKPPSMVVPEACQRVAELERLLVEAKRTQHIADGTT